MTPESPSVMGMRKRQRTLSDPTFEASIGPATARVECRSAFAWGQSVEGVSATGREACDPLPHPAAATSSPIALQWPM
jgi:hypothetical protein